MSNFAIIPWTSDYMNDRIFENGSSDYINGLLKPYIEFREVFMRNGHSIHTIDKYMDDYENIDFFLFFTLDWSIYHKVVKAGKSDRMVYCTAEPPSVYEYNSDKGYRILKHIFPYIMTWNDDWIDNVSVFKRNIPYFYKNQIDSSIEFKDKNLLTCICGNKKTSYNGELYSEREKAILYFEKYHPEEFRFFGTGWDEKKHSCYGGRVNSKAEVYNLFKFAICFENIGGLNGYITEKILDCLACGIVPIYAGAPDIDQYIPNSCFINMSDFSSYDELYKYMNAITVDEYNNYLVKADEFCHSDGMDLFSGSRYAECILDAVKHPPKYRSSYIAYKLFGLKYLKDKG